MRPLRSFLLLLIFLACFTGLHYFIPDSQLFPSIYEFVPANLVNDLFSDVKTLNRIPVDSVTATIENLSVNPLQGFLDSLRYSRGQLRIMYYGDSQIEGDRITSYIRQTLRKDHGGAGPGLFLPLMPVMYWGFSVRSSPNGIPITSEICVR